MFGVQGDYESYLIELKRARRRSVVYLVIALAVTLTLGSMSLVLMLRNPGIGSMPTLQFVNFETILNLAHFSLNIAVASMMRYWYLRQDKLTTLLTQAMVIEQKHDMAIRVLLKQRRSR